MLLCDVLVLAPQGRAFLGGGFSARFGSCNPCESWSSFSLWMELTRLECADAQKRARNPHGMTLMQNH